MKSCNTDFEKCWAQFFSFLEESFEFDGFGERNVVVWCVDVTLLIFRVSDHRDQNLTGMLWKGIMKRCQRDFFGRNLSPQFLMWMVEAWDVTAHIGTAGSVEGPEALQ